MYYLAQVFSLHQLFPLVWRSLLVLYSPFCLFFIFYFFCLCFELYPKNCCQGQHNEDFFPLHFLLRILLFDLRFKPSIHFKLIFVYIVRFTFILLQMDTSFAQHHLLKTDENSWRLVNWPLLPITYLLINTFRRWIYTNISPGHSQNLPHTRYNSRKKKKKSNGRRKHNKVKKAHIGDVILEL